ncbi:BTAD domain-containing putative transcriptional regulator [uncultured Desulfobacter sp.]|uniref:BTAD domain-containing putative transcriptional regulator n=1 Tax=uncultured Desulfobacter sp. TaxID=240139 RepID=UPI0029F5A99C|nr:BTAD domain-containing putative transcriptional regulator [uncultured Desulfobacter sp.]
MARIDLSRLHLAGQVAQITEADLRFTPEETRQFLTRHLKPTLPQELAAPLHRISCGWVTGLVLVYLGLKDCAGLQIKDLPADLTGLNKLTFSYFEETIFQSLPPETQEFMLKTSLLDSLNPEVCNALLRITASERILDELVAGHLLTYRNESGQDGDVVYTYHHLLRSFLRIRLKQTLSQESVAELYLSMAGLKEVAGDNLGAVRAYISGEFFDKATQRLMTHEKMLFESGQILWVQGTMNAFPKQFILANPQLLYIQARLESFLGNSHKSVSLYQTILSRSDPKVSEAFALNCRIELGLNYYYSGHLREAKNLLETCLTCKSTGKRLEVSGLLILIYLILGKISQADQLAQTAKRDICQLPDSSRMRMKNWIEFVRSYRYFVTGDFKTAYAKACRSLDWYSRTDAAIIMPLAYLHAALPAYFLNQFNTGYRWAKKGLDLIREMGVRDNQKGWLNYAAALHLCGQNRLDQALTRAQKGMSLFKHQANYWGQANIHDLIHFIRLKQTDLAGAEKALEQGLTLLRRTGLTMTEGILETGMLGVWLETGRFETVLEKKARVLEKVRASKFYTFKIMMISAQCRLHLNDRAAAIAELVQAIDIAVESGYAHRVANAGAWIEPLLLSLYATGVRQGFIREVFHMNGRANDLLPEPGAGEPVHPLQISLLGRFCMTLGGQDLRPEAFNNTKALMMIKYLALNHGKGFKPRDELIELLWPEQDFNKTRKRFNVVASAIRKFFEPGIRRGEPSRYLKKQGNSFCLSLGLGGSVDVLIFQDAVHEGSAAKDMEDAARHYETALTLYKGPFLAEDAYTQWCIEEREKWQGIYLSVLWKLICHFLKKSDPEKGIYYAQKYLETDDSIETVYQKLMQLYAAAGNRSLVKKTFETCQQKVFEFLDCPPEPETIRLFHECLAVQKADKH